MSLDWSIADCEDWEELNSEEEWPITNALIWRTMVVGFGRITEDNYEEFFERNEASNLIYGPAVFKWDENKKKVNLLTLAAIKRRIGLNTNVTTLTKAKWEKDFMRRVKLRTSEALGWARNEEKQNERSTAA